MESGETHIQFYGEYQLIRFEVESLQDAYPVSHTVRGRESVRIDMVFPDSSTAANIDGYPKDIYNIPQGYPVCTTADSGYFESLDGANE